MRKNLSCHGHDVVAYERGNAQHLNTRELSVRVPPRQIYSVIVRCCTVFEIGRSSSSRGLPSKHRMTLQTTAIGSLCVPNLRHIAASLASPPGSRTGPFYFVCSTELVRKLEETLSKHALRSSDGTVLVVGFLGLKVVLKWMRLSQDAGCTM